MVVDQLGKVACAERKKSIETLKKSSTQALAGLFVVMDNEEEDVYTDDDDQQQQQQRQQQQRQQQQLMSPGGAHLMHLSGRMQGGLDLKSSSGGGGGSGGGAQVDSLDRLSREFDRCFFMGDLNYRLDAGKEWVEHYLKMAELMRRQEKAQLVALKDASDKLVEVSAAAAASATASFFSSSSSSSSSSFHDQEVKSQDVVLDLDSCCPEEGGDGEERASEKKIEKVIGKCLLC
jgi:hypothetical protein